jgi:hypothetical protein
MHAAEDGAVVLDADLSSKDAYPRLVRLVPIGRGASADAVPEPLKISAFLFLTAVP